MPLDQSGETSILEWAVGIIAAAFAAALGYTNRRIAAIDERRAADDDKLWTAINTLAAKHEQSWGDIASKLHEFRNDLIRTTASRTDLEGVKRDLRDDLQAHERRMMVALAEIRRGQGVNE